MNSLIENFHFIRPAAFLLVLPVVLVWSLWQRRSDPLLGWRQQIDADLLDALTVGEKGSLKSPARWLLAGWLIAVVPVAGPTWRLEPSPFVEDATPLMILLKADVSMDTPEPAPSRLERAQLKIADLAALRAGKPLGLIAYAGSAHLVLPPTHDTAVVAQMAGEVSVGIMPVPGDRLDLALLEAARVLERAGKGGSLIVLCDVVDSDLAALEGAAGEVPFPIQFLQIQSPDSPKDGSLPSAASVLKAAVEPLSFEGSDVVSIVRRAGRAPTSVGGDEAERWEESGYWLLPLLALILLSSFRRTQNGEVTA